MSKRALSLLKRRFSADILEIHDFRGDETAIVDCLKIVEISRWLKETPELNFDMLTDMTAVDYFPRVPRFEVVYHFYSIAKKHRLRLKVQIPEEDPHVDTLCGIWAIANWLEREIWDMYGIKFHGHPDLRRILLYEEFVGYPLRKDYPKDKRQPLFRRPEHEIAEALDKKRKARSLTAENC